MEDECAVPGTTDPEHENTIPEDAVADTDDGQGFKLVVSNIKYVDARRIEKILRDKCCSFRTVHKKCSTVSFATIEFDDEDAMQNAKAALVGFVIKAIQAGPAALTAVWCVPKHASRMQGKTIGIQRSLAREDRPQSASGVHCALAWLVALIR
jgi:hypothetical protein